MQMHLMRVCAVLEWISGVIGMNELNCFVNFEFKSEVRTDKHYFEVLLLTQSDSSYLMP